MSVFEVIKNQNFFKNLEEKHQNGKLANAMLFFCDDEITSKNALILTALMLNYSTYQLFNENSAEVQRVENGADLDIKVYPKNKEKLLVSDSNEIVDETFIKPVGRDFKVFIINSIDSSTEQAQNKLLKVLEEPPKNVYFLLSASAQDRVLPTIKSRCDKIFIPPIDLAEMRNICGKELACILGKGYIGKTEQFAKNPSLQESVDFAVSLVCELKNSTQVLKFSKDFQDRDLDLILQVYLLCLEDMLKIKAEKEELCELKPYLPQLKSVEMEFSVTAICEICKIIEHLREKFEFNANYFVAIDNFLLKILEVKYICK